MHRRKKKTNLAWREGIKCLNMLAQVSTWQKDSPTISVLWTATNLTIRCYQKWQTNPLIRVLLWKCLNADLRETDCKRLHLKSPFSWGQSITRDGKWSQTNERLEERFSKPHTSNKVHGDGRIIHVLIGKRLIKTVYHQEECFCFLCVLGLLGTFTVYTMKQFNNPTLNAQFNNSKQESVNVFSVNSVLILHCWSEIWTPAHC